MRRRHLPTPYYELLPAILSTIPYSATCIMTMTIPTLCRRDITYLCTLDGGGDVVPERYSYR